MMFSRQGLGAQIVIRGAPQAGSSLGDGEGMMWLFFYTAHIFFSFFQETPTTFHICLQSNFISL